MPAYLVLAFIAYKTFVFIAIISISRFGVLVIETIV
jgi:hypothetical protein